MSEDQEVLSPDRFNHLRIYQVMVSAFQDGDPEVGFGHGYGPGPHYGDLKGITNALPYIKSLGMNTIWLTPIFDVGQTENLKLASTGYYPNDYFKIDPRFGTLEEAKTMVDKAHELGLYVFFDGVFGHHGGNVNPSPSGKLPVGPAEQVEFPASLPFYEEVILYWIDELEIDGWRLDQAYQVPLSSWQHLRQKVIDKCQARKKEGHKWGTLGYMVAEIFAGETEISKNAYGMGETSVLPSAFDFPLRYRLVQSLAVEESGKGFLPASNINEGFKTHDIYPADARPNLMLGNHDLVRFGDLIERAGYEGPSNRSYWDRHEVAFAFLTAFTGPITILYNEEIGAEISDFSKQVSDSCWIYDRCDDHVARNAGRILGLSQMEENLKTSFVNLMHLREKHPALSHGHREHLFSNENVFVDLKSLDDSHILCVLNLKNKEERIPSRVLLGENGAILQRLYSKKGHFSEKEDQFELLPFGYGFWVVLLQ